MHVITAPKILLDNPGDRRRLAETVDAIRPVLLVLDPFIRLHRIDENAASEVAPLLGYLRELQRRFEVAVMLVHHARKDARGARPGQALRGSSDLHGWGDSNLYLRRTASGLRLSVEHRAAPGRDDLPLELREYERGPALRLIDGAAPDVTNAKPNAADRILGALAQDPRPASARELRRRCAMRSSTLCAALPALVADGHVERTPDGLYRLAASAPPFDKPRAGRGRVSQAGAAVSASRLLLQRNFPTHMLGAPRVARRGLSAPGGGGASPRRATSGCAPASSRCPPLFCRRGS